jgi:hypothetical protein
LSKIKKIFNKENWNVFIDSKREKTNI